MHAICLFQVRSLFYDNYKNNDKALNFGMSILPKS